MSHYWAQASFLSEKARGTAYVVGSNDLTVERRFIKPLDHDDFFTNILIFQKIEARLAIIHLVLFDDDAFVYIKPILSNLE